MVWAPLVCMLLIAWVPVVMATELSLPRAGRGSMVFTANFTQTAEVKFTLFGGGNSNTYNLTIRPNGAHSLDITSPLGDAVAFRPAQCVFAPFDPGFTGGTRQFWLQASS